MGGLQEDPDDLFGICEGSTYSYTYVGVDLHLHTWTCRCRFNGAGVGRWSRGRMYGGVSKCLSRAATRTNGLDWTGTCEEKASKVHIHRLAQAGCSQASMSDSGMIR